MKSVFLFSIFFTVFCFTNLFSYGQHPYTGGYNVYYGSLHNHTNVSDGKGTVDQAYNYARNTAKLDFFGLAEHSNMMTSTEWTTIKNTANSYNTNGVFAAFYGFEWTTFLSYGHVAVINTEDYCSNTSPTNTFSGLLSWLNVRNGIAFFNHPGWDPLATNEFNKFTGTPSDKFVGMELWNDKDVFSKYYYNNGFYPNDGGKNYFNEALERGWKIGAAGSDDNHSATWGTATNYRVGVLATNLNRTDILEAFRARRFFATLDKNLYLSFKINGAEMGSTVQGGICNLEINAGDLDGDIFQSIVLVKNGIVDQTWKPFIVNPKITTTISCSDKDYFYIRVMEADGNEAISSPIFISGTINKAPTVSIINPINNSEFSTGQNITITANAYDNDGTISKVEFYHETLKLGEDLNPPYEYVWSGIAAGSYMLTAKATDNLNAVSASAAVYITVKQDNTTKVQSKILYGKDDAEEYSRKTVVLNSKDLNLVYDNWLTGNQTVGLIFRNLNIPKGATITNAYIQFTASKTLSGSTSLVVKGQATDNASDFITSSGNLSGRVRTSSSVSWSPVFAWNLSTKQNSPDIKSIIQEIINRAGWSPSNTLALLLTGNGSRAAKSYDLDPGNAAILFVEYSILKSGFIKQKEPTHPEFSQLSPDLIKLYPNPVTSLLTIKFNMENLEKRISIYTIEGKLVQEIISNEIDTELQIDCSEFKSGMYIISVQTSIGKQNIKFMKQ